MTKASTGGYRRAVKRACKDMSEFGKVMRSIRQRKNSSQEEICAALGVTRAFLSLVESGKRKLPSAWYPILMHDKSITPAEKTDLTVAFVLGTLSTRELHLLRTIFTLEEVNVERVLDGITHLVDSGDQLNTNETCNHVDWYQTYLKNCIQSQLMKSLLGEYYSITIIPHLREKLLQHKKEVVKHA